MATITFRLNRPKDKSGKLKSTPVSIQVELYISKDKRFELTTGEVIIPTHWNPSKERAKATLSDHTELNIHLDNIRKDLVQLWRDNKSANKETLRGLMCDLLRGELTVEKKTVIEAVQQFVAQYAKEKNKSTLGKYNALLSRLTDFYSIRPFDFSSLDFNFYDAFKNYLYSIPNSNYTGYSLHFDSYNGCYVLQHDTDGYKVGLFDEVVFKYFTNLKTICAWAEKRGFEVNPAYKSWEIIKRDYAPISLTLEELKDLEVLQISPNSVNHLVDENATNKERESERKAASMDIARDYLSLECRTGQRISDLSRFSESDINGNLWTFTQKKGNRLNSKRIALPLVGYCAPALLILQKYNYHLPKINEQNLNYSIKEVCKLAGIDTPMYIERWAGNKKIRIPGKKFEFISTHTGRKTFITITLQFLSPKLVMDLTGIRSFKTLKHYNGESEIGTIESALRGIEDNMSLMRKAQ